MEARFLGHAAILLTSKEGTSLLVDPYNPGGFGGRMAYHPIEYRADAVVCTHGHLDHCAIDDLPNRPELLEDEAEFGPFEVRRHRAEHDEYGGRRFGGSVDILDIEVDGVRLVHLSDVGHSPRAELVEALWRPDVVFLPVGGYFTIGAAQAFEWWRRLAARRVVPVHYRTDGCRLPLDERDHFQAYLEESHRCGGSCVEVESPMINFEDRVVFLDPEC